MALGSVTEEEDGKLSGRLRDVVPLGGHAKGERQSITLLDGNHLPLGGLLQDNANRSLTCSREAI